MNLKTLSFLSLLTVSANIWAQTYNWTEQIITDRAENLQNFAQAEDGSATIVGFGNIFERTTDGAASWQDAGVITNADEFDYQDISFFGDIGYAVAMTGFKVVNRESVDLYANSPILKTIDGGMTWSLLSTEGMGSGDDASLNITAVGNYMYKFTSVECINDTVAYISAYWKDVDNEAHQNVYKTTNAGTTWSAIIPDNKTNIVNSILEYNGNMYIAGKETLYKISVETDSLTNLYPIVDEGEDDGMYFAHTTTHNNTLIFPTTGDSIWTTSDEGATFQKLPNIKKGNIVYKHNDSTYVVGSGSSDTKASTDGGKTWLDCSADESLWNGGIVGDSLVGLGKQDIFTMALTDIDNGIFNWTKNTVSNKNKNLKAITTNNGTTYIAGMGDILISSTNGTSDFTEADIPNKSDIIYASVEIDFRGLAQGKGGAAIASTRKYKLVDYPTSGPDDIYANGVIYKTDDNWSSYDVVDESLIGKKYGDAPYLNPNSTGCYGLDFYSAECINDTTFYVSTQWYDTLSTDTKITYTRVFKTTNGGESWDTITSELNGKNIQTINFNDDLGYIGGSKTFLKSSDGGKTVENLYPKLEALADDNIYIQSVEISGADTLYVLSTSDGVFTSFDAGATFSLVPDNEGANGFVFIDTDSWMLLGSSNKSKYTNNSGTTWEGCYSGSTSYGTGGIYNDSIIALCKSKIYKLAVADLDSDISGINEAKTSESKIKIWQNGSALNIQSESQVSYILLYNISGQLVKSARANSNFHSMNISQLSRGIYIVRADEKVTKILVK